MRIDNRLLAALVFSLLVHAMVVSSPGWRLPFFDEPEANGLLEARLAPKRTAPPEPKPAPATAPPLPQAPAKPRRVPAAPVPEALPPAPAVAPAAEQPAAEPPAALSPAVVPIAASAEIPWPRQGRIRFAVTRGEGEQGMQIGQSTHTWQHDGLTYKLLVVSETTGLVALFRAVNIVQSSEGRVTAAGLSPEVFGVERNGRAAEGVRFDWAAGKAALTSKGEVRREVALPAPAQDLISQIYQIGLIGTAARVDLTIATGKNVGRYAYEAVGEEKLATRFGELRTWRVKTPALPGEQAMELWLAQDYRNLPVRIRFIDRKGEVFEQNAVEFETDGMPLGAQLK